MNGELSGIKLMINMNHEHKNSEEITLPVNGMSCASCAITIRKTLKKQEGVIDCDVNYGNEKAKIEFDPAKTNIDELNKKIEPLGYSLNQTQNPKPKTQNHTMSHEHQGMDHSAHLGIGQSKDEKLKELDSQKQKVYFVMPITILVFALMMWEIAAQSFSQVPAFFIPHALFQVISLILATIVLFWIGGEFLKEIWIFAKYRVANMYTLVGIGTLSAYVYSAIIVLFSPLREFLGLPEMAYFDVTIVVIGFIYLGKFLETRSKLMTGEAIEKLLNLQAKTAIVLRDGNEIEINVDEVRIGDIVIIKPGGKIPLDGKIIEGKSSIVESMITGESMPIDKKIGDNVIGGTINKQGAFKFKAEKIGSDTLLSQIIKMVDEAQGSRAPIQRLADRISEIFVPTVLVISVITLFAWLVIGSFFMPFSDALSLGLISFTGVLVIACPCALGLATPTAIIVGTGKGAENGILIKNAESLEKLHKVNIVVTDKTGTITKGKPEVTDIITQNPKLITQNTVLQILASLENNSEHPLAHAILEKAKIENIKLLDVDDFEIIEGKGLKGQIKNEELRMENYYAGNTKLLDDLKISYDKEIIDKLTKEGKTPVFLANDNELLSIIGIADTLKENAKYTVNELHKLGIKVVMLTGDNENTAKFIANQVGIDAVVAEVLPQDKALVIKALQKPGKNKGVLENFRIQNLELSISNIVGMLGDGINDAPALAQADVGIAMGTGTDVAIESAEITLLHGDFSKVLKSIKLSKFTMSAIKQNLFWAFAYNIVGIPLAAGLLFPVWGITINPIFAGLAMALSSVSVISNSLRLKSAKI